MEGNAFQAGSQTAAGGLRHGPLCSSQGGSPPLGKGGLLHTSLLLPTFNSDQQLTETKTDLWESIGHIYKDELVRDIYPPADQELYEGTEPALVLALNNVSGLSVHVQVPLHNNNLPIKALCNNTTSKKDI